MTHIINPHRYAAGGGGPAVFPDDIADLLYWLQADAGTFSDAGSTTATADGTVFQWNDQSGNGNHFTRLGAGQEPVLKMNILNGLPVLRFDASNDGMQRSGLSVGIPLTAFIVYCGRTLTGGHRALAGGNNWLIGPYAGQHSFFGGGGFVANTDATVTADAFVAGVAWQPAVGTASFFVNTVDKTDTSANGTGGQGTAGVGAANPFGEALDGDIAEVFVYDRALTSGEIDDLHDYLQFRYALW
jgi:hypothetical protein